MNVSIFGGSQPEPGSPAYAEAYQLGKLLATSGHAILTGGYIGTMEAASRGASEHGGHVIGVTCSDIEAWRGVGVNAWVREERRFVTMQERLNELVRACDAAIALPGGPGTLTEVALTWNLMVIASVPPKPLILSGAGWRIIMETFMSSFGQYIPPYQRSLLRFAPDIPSAVDMLER